ncbi:MAG: radical SAM protein [Thermodesulfovibrionales bacterium]|jgi:MoaA/NifB/PqqE/SkfB family radical SAM enzyme
MAGLSELQSLNAEVNHQRSLFRHPLDFFLVMRQYWAMGNYMLRKFGLKSWYSFWHTKLFVADEGGEYDLTAPFLKRFPWLLRKPFKIEIEHSTVCNKHCTFCMHSHWQERQEQMPLERFKYILDSIPSLRWLNIAGIGSAFLHREFIGMLEYARKRHINVNFVDEFDFFDEEKARRIIELGINSIYVSFDAAQKETYEMMKKGCSFDRSLSNIRLLLDLKERMGSPFPVVHFRYLVTRLNYREMPDYIELIASLPNRGVRARVEFIGLITFPGVEEHYLPLSEIPEEIMSRVYENSLRHGMNLCFSHSDASSLPSSESCVRWTEPFVLVNGEVIPDCAILMQSRREFLRRSSFGNALKTPFMQIWNSRRYRDFRSHVVKTGTKLPRSCESCCAFNVSVRMDRYGVTDEFLSPIAADAASTSSSTGGAGVCEGGK